MIHVIQKEMGGSASKTSFQAEEDLALLEKDPGGFLKRYSSVCVFLNTFFFF